MPARITRKYTHEEVSKHNIPSDLWLIHSNKVYDLTEFAADHPGGEHLIQRWGGKDVTDIMADLSSHAHSEMAYEVLAELCIGEVVDSAHEEEERENELKEEHTEKTQEKLDNETNLTRQSGISNLINEIEIRIRNADGRMEEKIHSAASNVKTEYDGGAIRDSIAFEASPSREIQTNGFSGSNTSTPYNITQYYTPNQGSLTFHSSSVSPVFLTPTNDSSFGSPMQTSTLNSVNLSRNSPGSPHPTSPVPFFDFSAPLVPQLLSSSITKSQYLSLLRNPTCLPFPIRLFRNPYLEFLSTAPWYIVLLIWVPWMGYHYKLAREGLGSLVLAAVLAGVYVWIIVERNAYKAFEWWEKERKEEDTLAIICHFAAKGIHSLVPTDKNHLVTPPIIGAIFFQPFLRLAYILLPRSMAHGLISGMMLGYITHELLHYYFHHATVENEHLQLMKIEHFECHHGKSKKKYYGILGGIF
ncbi:1244_t:CDS:2 [Paraglomus occultum]|uniref:1244_t:CDS:1 n=1 Tax=Paraglomus occultum TaxID=144539 RepID=A0A9N8VMW4_9GLOM|nr:1244_t:CDS:2 [Paraglomus occultum]